MIDECLQINVIKSQVRSLVRFILMLVCRQLLLFHFDVLADYFEVPEQNHSMFSCIPSTLQKYFLAYVVLEVNIVETFHYDCINGMAVSNKRNYPSVSTNLTVEEGLAKLTHPGCEITTPV
jgi:hypothetical protein